MKNNYNSSVERALSIIESNSRGTCIDEFNKLYIGIVNKSFSTDYLELGTTKCEIWINGIYHKETNETLTSEEIRQVIRTLSYEALFEMDSVVSFNNRVAHTQNQIYYDLSNKHKEYVEITENGWQINDDLSSIHFSNENHQIEQCQPLRNGNFFVIEKYIRIPKYQHLLMCWLISCFIEDIQHPLMIVYGEQGSGKTTACEFLKQIVDPSVINTLDFPEDKEAFDIILSKSYLVVFDNLSKISNSVSDVLCRAVTGGATQKRKRYSDTEDVIMRFRKIIILNGISCVAEKPDLLDRSILIEFVKNKEYENKELSQVKSDFNNDLTSILGGIFDILSIALRVYPEVSPKGISRMDDFIHWGYAIGKAIEEIYLPYFGEEYLGYADYFIDEYTENRLLQNQQILEDSVTAVLLLSYMKDRKKFVGTMTELFNALKSEADNKGIIINGSNFPKHPNKLSANLTELKSNLKSAGILFSKSRTNSMRIITVINEEYESLPVYEMKKVQLTSDDCDDKNL